VTAIQYISQLPSAAAWGGTDLFPVTQSSTGPSTGTTRKLTVAQLFTSPTFTGTTTVGNNLANYLTITGGATGSPALLSGAGSDTNVGIGLLPKASYGVTATKLFIAPQASWAATQTANASRLRTQLSAFGSFTNLTGVELYPQFSISGGNQSGVVDTGSRAWLNTMTVDSDNINVSGGGPQGLSNLYLGLGVGNSSGAAGSAHKGGRNGLDSEIFILSDVDIGPGSLFHVGVAGGTTAYRKMGGTAGGPRGNVFGSNVWGRARNGSGPGPRWLNSIVGVEVGVRQEQYVSALWKIGAQIVEENTSAENAIQQNIGLSLVNQPSATTIGWGQGISFSAYNGQYSIASNGQLIATVPTPIGLSAFAASDGMNLARIAFSRAAIETPGMYVDGSGNLGGQTVGGLALQTVSAVNAKVSTVSSVTVIEGGAFDGGASIATTATYLNGATAITVASFAGITNGMLVSGANIQAGTTLVSGAGTVNFVISLPTTGPGTAVAIAFTQPLPSFTLASPLTSGGIAGTTATMTVTNMGAVGFTGITTGGSGYTAGDVLTAIGGTGTAFTITVETVTSGQPVNIRVQSAGDYTVLPTNPVSFTGGTGTGFTCGMRWTILTISNTAGTNYNELRPPVTTFTGAIVQTKEARFKVAMTAGTAVDLVLNSGATTQTTSRIVGTRVVTAAGAVTVATTDDIVIINKTVGAATVANLPAGVTGRRFTIKDGKGDAAANNITITPAAGTIDGAATLIINTNFGRATVAYNGTQWNQV